MKILVKAVLIQWEEVKMDQKWRWSENYGRKQARAGPGGLDSGYKGRQGSEKCFSMTVQEIPGTEESDHKQSY